MFNDTDTCISRLNIDLVLATGINISWSGGNNSTNMINKMSLRIRYYYSIKPGCQSRFVMITRSTENLWLFFWGSKCQRSNQFERDLRGSSIVFMFWAVSGLSREFTHLHSVKHIALYIKVVVALATSKLLLLARTSEILSNLVTQHAQFQYFCSPNRGRCMKIEIIWCCKANNAGDTFIYKAFVYTKYCSKVRDNEAFA